MYSITVPNSIYYLDFCIGWGFYGSLSCSLYSFNHLQVRHLFLHVLFSTIKILGSLKVLIFASFFIVQCMNQFLTILNHVRIIQNHASTVWKNTSNHRRP